MIHDSHIAVPPTRRADLILLCDHASNRLPQQYHTLGLPPAEFERHIAYDIGAEAVTQGLASRLGGAAFFARFSRLLIDPNRGTDDPTLIMKLSDGAVIPGNARINEEERQHRIETYHQPYHRAISAYIDSRPASGTAPILVSLHSFTPVWRGVARPWHAGILWDLDGRLPLPLLEALRSMPGLTIGDNEPYHGALEGDTLNVHGTRRGLAHALVEIRQDLIATQRGVDEWVERLASVLEPIMNDPILHEVKHFGGL